MLEDCAVTVGLVRTVRIRPEQHLAGGESHLSTRGGGGFVGHRGTPGAAVLQEAVVERAASVHAVGAGPCGPHVGGAACELLLDEAVAQVLLIGGGHALHASCTPGRVDGATLIDDVGAGSGRPVGALTVGEGDCDGVGAGFLVGGQAAESRNIRAELVVQAAVGDQPVRAVGVRPVDGLAVGELLRVHAVPEVVFGADRVAVEGAVVVPVAADAGANINGAGRGGHHVRILCRAVFCCTVLNRAVLTVSPVAVHGLGVLRQNLQVVHGAGEEVRVTHERARVGELPNIVAAPTRRNCTHHGGVARQVQRQGAELLGTHAV